MKKLLKITAVIFAAFVLASCTNSANLAKPSDEYVKECKGEKSLFTSKDEYKKNFPSIARVEGYENDKLVSTLCIKISLDSTNITSRIYEPSSKTYLKIVAKKDKEALAEELLQDNDLESKIDSAAKTTISKNDFYAMQKNASLRMDDYDKNSKLTRSIYLLEVKNNVAKWNIANFKNQEPLYITVSLPKLAPTESFSSSIDANGVISVFQNGSLSDKYYLLKRLD